MTTGLGTCQGVEHSRWGCGTDGWRTGRVGPAERRKVARGIVWSERRLALNLSVVSCPFRRRTSYFVSRSTLPRGLLAWESGDSEGEVDSVSSECTSRAVEGEPQRPSQEVRNCKS